MNFGERLKQIRANQGLSQEQIDVNQWSAKTWVRVDDISQYILVNKGRKSRIYCLKGGAISEEISGFSGDNIISVSGIGSELIVSGN